MKSFICRPFLALIFAQTLGLSFLFTPSARAEDGDDRPENRFASEIKDRCETTKEFVTTFEYLKSHSEFGLSDKENFDVAQKVAKGCTGAAARFAKAFELLLKVEAGPRNSLQIAIDLANKSQEYSDTFVLVFTRCFLAEYLDLDYKTSFDLAKRLSVDYTGLPQIAAKDFTRLVDFCTDDKEVGLSKPRCGILAGRVVQRTQNFRAQTADEFIKVYRFMVSQNGASSPTGPALEVAENVVAQGPEASDNFISAYKYGIEQSGLSLTAKQSLEFAMKLAQNTWYNAHDGLPMKNQIEMPTKTSIEVRAPAATSAPLKNSTSLESSNMPTKTK
jgi:hypothetical protein